MTGNKNVIIELKSVSKSYQLGETIVEALKNVNLQISAGEFTALIGVSGSGKSTLLHLVGGLDDPDKGEIFIEGQDIQKFTENQRSQWRNEKVGFVFQSFNLIPVLNAFENVELPLLLRNNLTAKDREEKVMAALKDVGIESFRNQKPDKLSGGQRQRVAIARALVTDPILVLADEPTANLDSKTTHHIVDLLLHLNSKKQVTFLFCSHDEKLIGRVGRVVRIQDGEIIS